MLPTDSVRSGELEWHVIHPGAVLNLVCREVPAFADALKSACIRHRCSPERPLELIYYADEATSGNLLHLDPSRKSWLFYWGFREQREQLSHESCWMLGGVLRVRKLHEVTGNLAAVFKRHLDMFFGSRCDMRLHGITVHCADSFVFMLWACLKVTLADEDGLRKMWSLTGASGLRSCIKCANVYNSRLLPIEQDGDLTVSYSCCDFSKIIPNTNEMIWHAAERVAAAPAGVRKEMGKFHGISHNAESVLLDMPSRELGACPADCIYFDPMHVLVCNGVVNIELYQFLEVSSNNGGITYESIHTELQAWHWPYWVSSPPVKLCDRAHKESSRNAAMFKGGASDVLNMFPILLYMLRRQRRFYHRSPEMSKMFDSMMLLGNVVLGFVVLLGGREAPGWGRVIQVWYAHFLATYPDVVPRWKHHAAVIHLCAQLASGFFTCFPTERKHKKYKLFAQHVTNMKAFEKTLSVQLLNEQLRELKEGPALKEPTYLSNPSDEHGTLKGFLRVHSLKIAKSARHNGNTFAVDDMVALLDKSVFEVRVCMFVDNFHFEVLAVPWVQHGDWYEKGSGHVRVPFGQILGCCMWRSTVPIGARRVLLPASASYVHG